ncbi:HNH endonuclease signature motif containing protein [Aliarcobacter butzleri]|uniref:HNH endonuclease signature motif containing protein n=1 Tax=Aliarcobacter butzleri TaxID=28197 RepID=UPI002B24A07A|nr:HNH endonuclease signature motif containing protein [Aliarcobacter butzleri]
MSISIESFVEKILPGNYCITKSMDFSKVDYSGTLWYLKKWMVYYNYLFFKDNITTTDYEKIVDVFNKFIQTLPTGEARKNAENFFFEVDIRNKDEYITFQQFINDKPDLSELDSKKWNIDAKKFYFCYVMNLGGQANYKKMIKNKINQKHSYYECCEILLECKSSECEKLNKLGEIIQSIKKECLSNEMIIELKKIYTSTIERVELAKKEKSKLNKLGELIEQLNSDYLTEDLLVEVKKLEKLINKNINDIGLVNNDFPASIRNEKQIFFYWGFFHGKETKDLSGFYNLTNIGKLILDSTFDELILIWEHQKLKMISQSPLTDMQKLNNDSILSPELFEINKHPYITLLEVLIKNNEITLDEYQYVISRVHSSQDLDFVLDKISDIFEKSYSKVQSFNRTADNNTEDFKKELLKFILGISEMKKDANSNYFSFLTKYDNKKVSINNSQKAKFILEHYKYITTYLDTQYKSQYEIFKEEIKKQYKQTVSNMEYEVDKNAQYEWSKYIINIDKNIYLGLIYLLISMKLNCLDNTLKNKHFNSEYDSFKSILKSFGIKSKAEFLILMNEIQEEFKTNDRLLLRTSEENEYQVIDPKEFASEITLSNLNELSIKTALNNTISRKRDTSLIQNIKSYYFTNFLNEGLLSCDCCKETTFLTMKGYPYIEFHHLIPFSTDFGPDHYLNLFGLCPSCHRKMHFIEAESKNALYYDLSLNNNLKLSFKQRINELLTQNILEAIHLEFLLKENVITKEEYEKYMNSEQVA